MQVYFMRHGQTNYNLRALCNSDPTRDVHLTEQGRQQAQAVADKLKAVNLDQIFVSELPRTRQTAEIVNQYHRATIETNSLINDIRTGFEDQPVSTYYSAIAHDPLYAHANDGESLIEHKQRVIRFLEWLKQKKYENVLVVAHEETLRVIYARFNRIEDSEMIRLCFDNCACFNFRL